MNEKEEKLQKSLLLEVPASLTGSSAAPLTPPRSPSSLRRRYLKENEAESILAALSSTTSTSADAAFSLTLRAALEQVRADAAVTAADFASMRARAAAGSQADEHRSRQLMGLAIDRALFDIHTMEARHSHTIRAVRDMAAVVPAVAAAELARLRRRLRHGERGALDEIRQWTSVHVEELLRADQESLDELAAAARRRGDERRSRQRQQKEAAQVGADCRTILRSIVLLLVCFIVLVVAQFQYGFAHDPRFANE